MSVNRADSSTKQLKMYSCARCNKKFSELVNLDAHIRIIHSIDICSFCSTNHSNKECFYDPSHSNCIFCLKPYAWIPRDINKKWNECPYCPKRFFGWQKLYVHLHIHREPFQCPICGKNFSTRCSMRRHLIWKHKEIPCSLMPSIYS